jgi:outer membrane protein OmpA-like peptidoglycan-associated protein
VPETPSTASTSLARTAAALLLVTLTTSLGLPGQAWASPGVTLDQYHVAPHGDDGFTVSRPQTPGHLQLQTSLGVDYSSNPLVYELKQGASNGKKVALVSDQLAANLGVSLGVFDRLLAFATLPVNLVLSGTAFGSQPTATGAGAGDFALGARGVFYRAAERGALALQLSTTFPTGAGGSVGPAVAGESGLTLQPSLLAELAFPILRITANAGLRIRKQLTLPSASFGNELSYALALALHVLSHRLDAQLELFGVTPTDDVGRRANSPLEALGGLKLFAGQYTFGLASGVGVMSGYGSPQLRVAAMGAYRFGDHSAKPPATSAEAAPQPAETTPPTAAAAPEPRAQAPQPPRSVVPPPAAEPPRPTAVVAATGDSDGDGLKDADDQCPGWPGPAASGGCPQHFQYIPETGALTLHSPITWRRSSALLDGSADPMLQELAGALAKNHGRVMVLAHVAPRGNPEQSVSVTARRAQALMQWLQAHGVKSEQLEAYGCAGNRPIAPARTKNRWKNERVEFFVSRPLPKLGMPSTVGCAQVGGTPPPPDKPAQRARAAVPPTPAAAAIPPAPAPAPAAVQKPRIPEPPPAAVPSTAKPPTAAVAQSTEPIAPAEPPRSRTIGGARPRAPVQRSLSQGVQSE